MRKLRRVISNIESRDGSGGISEKVKEMEKGVMMQTTAALDEIKGTLKGAMGQKSRS